MGKIKFNKEWYRDNEIVVNLKTEDEANKFIKELIKVGITHWIDGSPLSEFNKFSQYGGNTCYNYDSSELYCASKSCYLGINYTVIKFSDLEFESEISENEPKITKVESEECGYKPVIEVDKTVKTTILRSEVKLKVGDIICTNYEFNGDNIGIITEDYILYNTGEFDLLSSIDKKRLMWYIPREDVKNKGEYISQFLFKGNLHNELKDLIIYVEDDKPKETKIKTYIIGISSNEDKRNFCVSDNPNIEIGDMVSIDNGLYSGRYGIVNGIRYEELTKEEIKKYYSNITKIK